MSRANTGNGSVSVLLLGLGLFLFLSPFTVWWLERDLPWYSSFLIWLGYILLIAITVSRRRRDDL